MPATRDLGPLYFHTCALDTAAPRFHQATTHEIDYPFRVGRALVARLGRRGLVLGRWRCRTSEDAAVKGALAARKTALFTVDGTLVPHFRREPSLKEPDALESPA